VTAQEEFARWISRSDWAWTTYGTLTFSKPMRRGALSYAKTLAVYAARTAPRLWGFSFEETHSDGEALHVHFLWHITPDLTNSPTNYDLWRWWYKRYGRAQIVPYRPASSVNRMTTSGSDTPSVPEGLQRYLSKYLTKSQDRYFYDFWCFFDGKEVDSEQQAGIMALDSIRSYKR